MEFKTHPPKLAAAMTTGIDTARRSIFSSVPLLRIKIRQKIIGAVKVVAMTKGFHLTTNWSHF